MPDVIDNSRTRNAITKAWAELRPGCKNDRSAVHKVTKYINDNKLTLRALREATVSQYTAALKLRPPFKRGANKLGTTPTPTTATASNGVGPNLDEFAIALKIIRQLDQLPPFCKKLVIGHLKGGNE